jgi:hypothetical protein
LDCLLIRAGTGPDSPTAVFLCPLPDFHREGEGRDGNRRPYPPARKLLAPTAAYKSQRPDAPRGVGVASLHLTEKEERVRKALG